MQRGLLIGLLVALTCTATAAAGFYAPPAPDTNPVWSPDASAIVYYRGGEGLHVVAPDGTHDRLLAGLPNSPYFAFSSDWHWIAFAVYGGTPGPAAIEVMRPDGSERRVVAHGACCVAPVFSPDGTRLAFADGTGISLVGVNGGAATRVVVQGVFPRWSPDGRRLSYSVSTLSGPHVVVNAFDGSLPWDAEAGRNFGGASTRGAVWANDGRIAFVVGTPTRIAVYDPAAGSMRTFRVDSAAALAWSPDGRRILFSDAHGLSALDVASGTVTPVAEGTDGDWSPDGTRVAYSATGECGDRAGIYVAGERITNSCRVLGTEGADTMRSSNALYEIVMGLGGDDKLVARGAPYIGSELDGGEGNDQLLGGIWQDRLSGDAGNDTLLGGANSDRLTGGPGTDILRGQGGQDILFSRDGEADLVDCGTNTGKTNKALENDKAYVDALDIVVHCEKVYRSR